MSAGKIGGIGGPQMMDMRYRGPEEWEKPMIPEFNPMPDIDPVNPPGYQQPPGGGGQQPQQGYQQYYQQMRESMSGMDKALKELEGMQMPGGQYKPNDDFDPVMFTTFGSPGK